MKAKISEICTINENNLSKSDNYEFINYLDTSNLTEGSIDEVQTLHMKVDKIPSRAKRKIKKKDILISTVRPNQKHYGIINNMIDNLIASTGFAVLSANEKIVDPEYLYHYLIQENITNYLQAIAEASTSTYPSIKPGVIGELELELPPLPEQKAIAHMLSTINEKIEVNNQINKTLENMAQAIFKNWFVDFEFPDENGNPYKSSGGKMIDSELGEIPGSWKISSLPEIAHYQNGLAMQKFRPKGKDSLPVIKIKELNQGFVDNNSELCDVDIKDDVKIYNGDVIFSWSATLLVKIWTGGTGGLNQHLFKVTSNKYPKWFYYYWTKKHIDNFINIAKDKATTMGHINRKHLEQAHVLIPNANQMNLFDETMTPFVDQLLNIGLENSTLKQLRDALLPKLISGELELPTEAEV